MTVDAGNSRVHSRAVPKDMESRIGNVRAEPAAKVKTVGTRISEEHIVSK